MKWSESHDILFAREVLVSSLYETRNGSPERGKVWDEIAENLNKLENPLFSVSKRSLRDRLSLLIKRYKAKVREEDRESGINPEEDEIDSLLEEICDKESEWILNPPSESKTKKAQQDKATAEEIRNKAMETLGETNKRKENNVTDGSTKKMRRSTGEAIHFLKEKAKADSLLKERELQLREKEQSNSALLLERQSQMQNDMLMFIQQQQQDQQNMQQTLQQQHVQTMQAMFQQQQIQNQALMSLLEKFASK